MIGPRLKEVGFKVDDQPTRGVALKPKRDGDSRRTLFFAEVDGDFLFAQVGGVLGASREVEVLDRDELERLWGTTEVQAALDNPPALPNRASRSAARVGRVVTADGFSEAEGFDPGPYVARDNGAYGSSPTTNDSEESVGAGSPGNVSDVDSDE